MKKTRITFIFVLGILLGISGSLLGGLIYIDDYSKNNQTVNLNSESIISSIKSSFSEIKKGSIEGDYKKFEEVLDILDSSFYEQENIKKDEMIDEALKGFVSALDDPYSVYFTNNENKSFQKDLEGGKDFEGIGAVVRKKERGVMIEQVLKGSPAYKSGLKPLDIIIKVDGEATKDLDLSEAVNKIKGEKGTKVELTIYRSSKEEGEKIFKKEVTRDAVSVPSVLGKTHNLTGNNKVGYLNISIIGEDTEQALKDSINDFKDENIKGVILDLRGNGGGFLPMAVEVASHFVPEGKEIVETKYRALPNETYDSKGFGDFEDMPVVVLVDGITASAAEIISAALRQQVGATLIGTQTFGKGSIQTIKDLGDGSSLKYTIGKWFTPDGRNVKEEGLTPDIEVKIDQETYQETQVDPQMKRAKSKILEMIK